ncbi:uroporphyrinogen III methyltransferase / synthase [Marininema mesophilum]|uniref:Uroporphyrinogen-III synthase n=1 Tax=Marininema mesophilum TaxID=1048340 RepID=A0A1H2S139_9BACL|nr:uroporphyrinogen-III synthase [Marininema mesophilum]SDW25327.1 uroporphyrinogen III methyltransferase / synthase [Marininema mesophilum]
MNPGSVTFVGAGPRAPDLLTLRGREALLDADVILYDEKVNPSLLEGRSDKAKKIPAKVGSEEILVTLAKAGKTIVRLVAGEALLIGEMHREAAALSQATIPFTIIPGVSELTAWTTYAGISLPSPQEWLLSGEDGTGLILHLDQSVAKTASQLIDRGWSPDTLASVITSGTEMDQQVVTERLAEWVNREEDSFTEASSFFVLSDQKQGRLKWFESKPIFGTRVLVTRTATQGRGLAQKIASLGGEAITIPTIHLVVPENTKVLDEALARLDSFSWVVFTSVNGVEFFLRRLRQQQVDIRRMHRAKIAAVGPKTAAALAKVGLTVDVVAKEFVGEGLVTALTPLVKAGEEVLLPRAAIARSMLPDELRQLGCCVTDAPTYDTLPDDRGAQKIAALLREQQLHILTFTSASTVRYFAQTMDHLGEEWRSYLHGVKVACIGPVTANAAMECGLQVDRIAEPYTIDALLEGITQLVQNEEH